MLLLILLKSIWPAESAIAEIFVPFIFIVVPPSVLFSALSFTVINKVFCEKLFVQKSIASIGKMIFIIVKC